MSTAETQPQSGTTDWDSYGKHRGRVLHREQLAEHVNLYVVEKPEGFEFRPGQAVELSIDEVGYREKKRPFTITSLPNNPRLEFIIKSYPTAEFPEHEGVTEHLGREIEVNDRVIFGDPWGTIEYQGPGVFIAGGAGITPFVSILRQLERDGELEGNRLFFSNKQHQNVFLQGELFRILGHAVVCTLTQEQHRDYEQGRIDQQWLQKRVDDFSQPFYLCGPPAMVNELKETLSKLGAKTESMVFEE
ncbi:FAD-binding oxidoreductase [Rhodopirellula halodulae]|uniref:FAD-binding oxidoreductase n=1 Tax=Rhodopirellula halodulae TaxID=2894198 RepID=UPI001E3846C8|nr:FAD-binding oxidoreductase [Rhodopirellula sp. JC737]MCC9654572.1 FAD-binding oxidoreductase [Rhodopirellula sp. JC737]